MPSSTIYDHGQLHRGRSIIALLQRPAVGSVIATSQRRYGANSAVVALLHRATFRAILAESRSTWDRGGPTM